MHGHHRHIVPPFKFQDRCKFDPGEVLHNIENGFLVYMAVRHVRIAFFTRQHDQTIWSDFPPKSLVVHWLEPVFNIVGVSKFHWV